MKTSQAAFSLAFALAATGSAVAQSQTAQSAMVQINLPEAAYQIDGAITWTYQRSTAETYYTNALIAGSLVVTAGNGAAQPTPPAPDAEAIKLMQHAQAERCTFFCGGNLQTTSYTQTVNGTKGWKWAWTYNIVPISATVEAHTAWTSEETGGTVDVSFDGFVASESYLKQANNKTKYSFTLVDGAGSRVTDVKATLQVSDGIGGWNNVTSDALADDLDADGDGDVLAVTPTPATYTYSGNAGTFGNAAVFSALHAPGYKPATGVAAILLEDNFANNNNDLASGNVHQANFAAAFAGITQPGSYRIVLTGAIKGNSATAAQGFSVSSNQVVIGGCTCAN